MLPKTIVLQDGREIPAKTEISENLIGLEGGNNETWFKIISVREAEIDRYPAVIDGKEVDFWEFESMKEYFKHKQKVTWSGAIVTTMGNAVSAEVALQRRGYRALAVGPNTVEIITKGGIDCEG